MSAPALTRVASCSCGRLTAMCDGDPVRVSICHCLACQRRTGSVYGVQARFRREQVHIAGAFTSYTRKGDSGKSITFHFCAACGATVFYEMEGQDEFIGVPVGAFADPHFPEPVRSIYETYRHHWVGVPNYVEHLE